MTEATIAKFRLLHLLLPGCLLVALLPGTGCQMAGNSSNYANTTANPFEEGGPLEQSQAEKPVVQTASAVEPTTATKEADLASVLAELDEIGDIDPLARQKLTNDLQGVKPELWALMVQQFKSAMAFRQQLNEEDSEPVGTALAIETNSTPLPVTEERVKVTPASMSSGKPTTDSTMPAPKAEPVQVPTAKLIERSAAEPVIVSDTNSAMMLSTETAASIASYPTTNASHYNRTQPLPIPPASNPAAMVATAQSDPLVRPATYVSAPSTGSSAYAPGGDWQEHLQRAIQEMETTVSARPASTEELHEHVQLRMLYLLAGDRGEAMLPIPGASPTLQDYWSKQLFAISTHLDHQQQPDEKRRAASSLIHLDQARAKLAELATLQIRNLSFVNSVDGYGTYEVHESREFRAGDPVTLYAEVENLRSESTPEGYEASLSTSYEVVDASGQRVDGRQFPDVEDLCQSPRRDFHMQYGVSLPTRIYPGEYQLRLTITDQLSHKIGQASVPFVIVE